MFADFILESSRLRSDMTVSYKGLSQELVFSNTGRRGGAKYFIVTLRSVLQALKDIRENLPDFERNTTYVEHTWRNLFQQLTDAPLVAMGTVQTLPLFSLLGKLIHVSNGLPAATYRDHVILLTENALNTTIAYLESVLPDEEELITPPVGDIEGENVIYYGAPGTGKSFKIEQRLNGHLYRRTVFHSETQYSDFVGSLKPVMETIEENGTTKDYITYKFIPGPFTLAYIDAWSHPDQHVFLVIEEINRAPAAGVFGELFQLLDRDGNGVGQYQVHATDPVMSGYINSKIGRGPDSPLQMPGNLSLLATMNSSDQAVMPMDTAFKRRWKFNYIKLDFSECAQGNLYIPADGRYVKLSWQNFAEALNLSFSKMQIPEDRHFGPFYVQSHELIDEMASRNTLAGKILLYVWDDILRHRDHHEIFHEEVNTFGQLISRFESAMPVFNDELQDKLLSYVANPAPVE